MGRVNMAKVWLEGVNLSGCVGMRRAVKNVATSPSGNVVASLLEAMRAWQSRINDSSVRVFNQGLGA